MFETMALLTALALGTVVSGEPKATSLHSAQTGHFDLALPAEQAFPLFSPEGERFWVEGWDPNPVDPADKGVRWSSNTVFTLDHQGEHSTWWIVEVDRGAHKADYVYVVTGSRAVRVTVKVTAQDANHCRVEVIYRMTALTPTGAKYVSEATDAQMIHKMLHWKQSIEEALARHGGVAPNEQ